MTVLFLKIISNILPTQQKEQAETEKGRIEKVEDVKTAALQGETKERSDEEAQPLKESTTSEESTAAVSNHSNHLTAIDTFMLGTIKLTLASYPAVPAFLRLRKKNRIGWVRG